MNSIARPFQCVIVFLITLLAATHIATNSLASADSPAATSCRSSAYREFDFWAGDWDVFDFAGASAAESRAARSNSSNSKIVARAKVDLILEGCVLREDYQGADGHKGQSFTIYDSSRKVWHQSWVTNRGELLLIEGNVDHDAMVMSGEDHAKGVLVRGTWKPENGNVRETAVTSTDGGKTWKPWFDLVFRPHQN